MGKSGHIVIVTTSACEYTDVGYRTGLWLGELTHFYDVVTEAGHEVVIASVAGGLVPLDPESLQPLVLAMGDTSKRYESREFMDLLGSTVAVADVDAADFDALYLTGGHGTMIDFPTSQPLIDLIGDFARQGKVISAVCHGPSGLLNVELNGSPLLAGRRATGFSWPEEKLARRADAVPFNLSEAMKARGAKYTKALRPMAEKVVVDDLLVTGQNPTSASGVAKAVVKLLKKQQ